MKKLFGITIAVTTVLCFVGGIAFAQTAAKPIQWRLVSAWSPSINLIEADKNFAKLVNEMSGGRLKISVHPAGELIPATEVFEAVSKGTFEIGGEWASYWGGKNSAYDLLGSFPMALGMYDYVNWIFHGGGKEIYNWIYGKNNMVYFPHLALGLESGVRSRMPIKNLADYKGKKLRMAGRATGYILKKLGASQVMVSAGEIYQALQMGTIDGAEFCTPSVDWALGFAEVTKNAIGPGWHQPSSILGSPINKDHWNKLPDDLKKIVENAATANITIMSSYYEALNIEALQKFKKAGTTSHALSREDLKTIEKYAWEYVEQECKRNPDFHKVALSQFQFMKNFRDTRTWQGAFGQGRNFAAYPKIEGLK